MNRTNFLISASSAMAAAGIPTAALGNLDMLGKDLDRRLYLDLSNGVFTPQQDGRVILDATFDLLKEKAHDPYRPQRTLVIYFHGGLVDRTSALNGAARLRQPFEDAGAFPFFFVYNVGAGESVGQGSANSTLYPVEDLREVGLINRYMALNKEDRIRHALDRSHGSWSPGIDDVTHVEEFMRHGGILSNVGWLGSLAWAYMKGAINNSLLIDATNGPVDPEQAGGYVFLLKLRDFLHTLNQNDYRIVLIGHSTGAIYISKFIRKAHQVFTSEKTTNQNFEVILLAPAVRYDDFQETLAQAGRRIANLRIFTMLDAWESRDHVLASTLGVFLSPFAGVYSHSLLYLISGVFEAEPDTPLVGLDRFRPENFACLTRFQDWPTGPKWRDIITDANERMQVIARGSPFALSPTGPGATRGWRSFATDHGDFPTDYETLDSMVYLVGDAAHWSTEPNAALDACNANGARIKNAR